MEIVAKEKGDADVLAEVISKDAAVVQVLSFSFFNLNLI